MQRTQIYLTSREAAALDAAGRATGRTRSHLIREAIEAVYLGASDTDDRLRSLESTAGVWEDRFTTGEATVDRLRSGRLAVLHADAAG